MSIEDDVRLLASVPTLQLLGIDALRVLAIGSETRRVRRDEALFRAGDTADAGYVVQAGALRVSHEDEGGYREVVAGPGVLIGELALLVEMQRPSTAVAISESSVLRISRSMFQRVLEGHPDAARRLRDDLASRTSQAASDMIIASSKLAP
ncbi:cyclic nucleotide-binding domain-containing protein [Bradyrhizobium sp. LHD-71]|uniref:cyclic nucleotide-binding domain-containing protein n=1 Tax=Bradyrhizobium sp. LHD-71 TaxID=3072141 RepID=UPI00280E861B|nr:cyclic nucleotide-binding domain-containing protein [Bradyrhizobium sp. LHD-71]MDQ8732625.1 cyclic nucleotide-binding domain-containing protein [Bradyrhizobium sp. LHD-71]